MLRIYNFCVPSSLDCNPMGTHCWADKWHLIFAGLEKLSVSIPDALLDSSNPEGNSLLQASITLHISQPLWLFMSYSDLCICFVVVVLFLLWTHRSSNTGHILLNLLLQILESLHAFKIICWIIERFLRVKSGKKGGKVSIYNRCALNGQSCYFTGFSCEEIICA